MKNKRKILLLVFVVLSASPLFSDSFSRWSIGAAGGYGMNHLIADADYHDSISYNGQYGWGASVDVSYRFSRHFGLESGIRYQQKNNYWENSNSTLDLPLYTQHENSFFEIPLLLSFTAGEKVRFTTSMGFFLGYWAFSTYESRSLVSFGSFKYEKTEGSWQFDSTRDNRFEAGFMAKGGMLFDLSFASLYVGAVYELSFTDMSRQCQSDQARRYNSCVMGEAGLVWEFGGDK